MHLHVATGRWCAALAPSTPTADVSTCGRSVSTEPVTRRDRPTPDTAWSVPGQGHDLGRALTLTVSAAGTWCRRCPPSVERLWQVSTEARKMQWALPGTAIIDVSNGFAIANRQPMRLIPPHLLPYANGQVKTHTARVIFLTTMLLYTFCLDRQTEHIVGWQSLLKCCVDLSPN